MAYYSLKVERKGGFFQYDKPAVVGYYSLDEKRNYHEDLSQLRYVQLPPDLDRGQDGATSNVNFDINKGWEKAIRKEEFYQTLGRMFPLDSLLRWFLNNFRKMRVIPDVVCSRGILTLLMCTPYESREGWIICATMHKGILYLCQCETESLMKKRAHESDRDRQMGCWGYKFEQYMCADEPWGRPDTSQPVNQLVELNVIFSAQLKGQHLLLGAEVDGVLNQPVVKSHDDFAKATLVELKTNRLIEHPGQQCNFEKSKLLKWWSQSHGVGIERLVCGFRDDRGVVRVLENFTVSDIPRKAVSYWDPNVCMNFCDQFLKFASTVVKEEDPRTVWKFEWKPPLQVVKAEKVVGPSEFSFLPSWFTNRSEICKKPVRHGGSYYNNLMNFEIPEDENLIKKFVKPPPGTLHDIQKQDLSVGHVAEDGDKSP